MTIRRVWLATLFFLVAPVVLALIVRGGQVLTDSGALQRLKIRLEGFFERIRAWRRKT